MRLNGKKLLIIGGASGIGKATASAASSAGAHVIIADRAQEHLASAQEELGDDIETCELDVRDPRELDFCFEQMKGFDDLVVTAAESFRSDFIDCDIDEAKKVFETKYWGQFLAAQRCIPFINKSGSITLFSGSSGRRVVRGESVLGAANCAVEGLIRSLATELSPIRINAVAPGDNVIDEQEEHGRGQDATSPVRYDGNNRDVAHAVLFLIENQSTTGTVLRVDRGATAA